MSTFPGILKELPNVSIDRFDGDNLKSSCFFLSHCHSDHMVGLNIKFAHFLNSHKDYYLYCSSITRIILLNDLGSDFGDRIVELSGSSLIKVPETETAEAPYFVTVTPLPAGHCPGSIMFLFETTQETVLYTGDFRIAMGDVQKFKPLHSLSSVKKIDKLYFDSTFLSENYWKFPTRKECLNQMSRIINNWLSLNPKNVVHINTSANYGAEFLYVELAQIFKCKINVKNHIYRKFWNVPEIGSVLTTNGDSRIHAGFFRSVNCYSLSHYDQSLVLKIKPSAQWFQWGKGKQMPALSYAYPRFVKVCYATHSSCLELVDFISHLKPEELEACTDVVGSSKKEQSVYIERLKTHYFKESELENRKRLKISPRSPVKLSPLKIEIPISNKKTEKAHKSHIDSPPLVV